MDVTKNSPLACALLLLTACTDGSSSEEGDASDTAMTPDAGAPDTSAALDARPEAAVEAGIDCTSAQAPCIAAQGIRNGTPFTCVSSQPIEDVVRLLVGTPSWIVSCDDGPPDFSLGVQFPVQEAGTLNLSAAPGGGGSLKFYLRAVSGSSGGSMTEHSSNLVSGTLSGTLDAAGLATGTLNATWLAPAASCVSGETGSACAQGSLKLTFRVPLP